MPSCIPKFFKCGNIRDVKETHTVRPALTKINSPTCSYVTNSLSKSPDYETTHTGPVVWSVEESPNWALHHDLLQLQSEKNGLLEENHILKNHGAELLALIELDQNEAANLRNELKTIKTDLGSALARNMKLEHRAYFTPLEGIFSLRKKAKEAEMRARKQNVSLANEEFTVTNLLKELCTCRAERDQAKDMLLVEKKCRNRDSRGDPNGSLFTLEIKAAALLHQARYMSKQRDEARLQANKMILLMRQKDA